VLAWPIVSTAFHAVFAMAANARLRLLLCFVSAMLTASLIDLAQRGGIRVYLIGIACTAGVLAYLIFGTGFPQPWHKDVAMLAIIPSMVVLGVAALIALERRAVALILVVIVAELWAAGRNWNPVLPERLMYPETPLIAKLKELIAGEHRPCRMVASGPVLFSNVPAMFGLDDIRAHDPMSNGRYLGTLRVVGGYDTSDYFAQWKNFDTRLLDFLNVCYVATTPDGKMTDEERYTLVYNGRDGRIFRNNDALPRFFAPSIIVLEFKGDKFTKKLAEQKDFSETAIVKQLPVENDRERNDLLAPRPPNSPKATVQLTEASDTEYELTVDAPRYSMIVSSLPWWPGWHVTRNGEQYTPLQPNGSFIGFVARPGITHVRVYYAPLTFRIAAILSLLTMAILAALSRESLRRRLQTARRSG